MFNYILYRIGEFLTLSLPLSMSYGLAGILSTLQYLLSKRDRMTVRGNLKAIFPAINENRLKKYTKKVFTNFGLYLADFFRFKRLNLDYIKKNVIVEGREYIDRALSGGRGLIIVSAHIGNWELGGVTLGILGYAVNAVTLTHKHKGVNGFFNRQRESNGLLVIPLEHAVRGSLEAFRRNEIVCILGDRDFTQGGLILDFFGLPTMIPKGPAVFSLRNKTPIISAFTIRQKHNKFRLSFSAPLEFSPSQEFEKDVRLLTQVYLRLFEDRIRKYPGQWEMFRQFWL